MLDQFSILKTIFNANRFKPMIPSLVSSDMIFILDEPRAYKSSMSDLPLSPTPGSKIVRPDPPNKKPTGHIDVATILKLDC